MYVRPKEPNMLLGGAIALMVIAALGLWWITSRQNLNTALSEIESGTSSQDSF